MTKSHKAQGSKAPGTSGSQGRPPRVIPKPDAEERYQRNKDQAPGDDGNQPAPNQQNERRQDARR